MYDRNAPDMEVGYPGVREIVYRFYYLNKYMFWRLAVRPAEMPIGGRAGNVRIGVASRLIGNDRTVLLLMRAVRPMPQRRWYVVAQPCVAASAWPRRVRVSIAPNCPFLRWLGLLQEPCLRRR
jgi:hypothetical protein